MTSTDLKPLLTATEAADMLGITLATIHKMVDAQVLHGIPGGSASRTPDLLIYRASVEAFTRRLQRRQHKVLAASGVR